MGEIMVRRRVQELIINDRIDEAIDLLEPIVRNDPKNLDMLARLVQLLIRQGRKDDALAYIKTAQQNDPDNENIRRWQSLLETDEPAQRYTIEMEYASRQDDPFRRAVMQWEIARRYGRTEEAVTFLAKAEEINPGNPVIIEARFRQALQDSDWQEAETIISRVDEQNNIQRELMRGRLAAAREDYESAVTYLQDVLDEKPHLPTPRLLLADCYAAQGQYEKAAEQYRQVIGNNASNIPAMVGLAKVSAAQQRFDEHEKWIRRAYRYPAGKVQPYVKERYLQIALETQDIKQAIDTREKTLAREPGNLENMFRLAALYEQDKQLDKAGQMLQQVYQRSANKIDFAPVLANFYLRMNQSSRADELFTGLLEQVQDPKAKARVYIHYGRFLAGFNPDGAEAMFQKAIQADPDSPAPYQALGDFQAAQAQQLSSQGQSAKARQKWQEAVATLDKAISKDPTNQQAKLVLYRRYIDAGEYDKAIEGYKRLLAESPESLPAQVGMGLAYLRSGRLDEALEHFDEALSINPNSADALVFRSEVYRSRGQLLQASEDMQKAAKFSSSAVLRMDLGRLYQAMGKLNAAAQEYDRVIVKQPDYFPAYQALLELFAQRERWSAVMNLAAQAREQFPRSAFFPMMLARAHKAQGQTAQFIQLLEEAVKLEPQNPNIVLNYLNGLLEAGKYDQLREEAKKYQDTPPYQAAVATLLAQARARQDGPQQAWPMFLSALKNSANPANLFNTIGRMKGIYSPAVLIERFDQIRSTQPDNWRMDMILGDLYMDVQQPAQAEQAYLKAQQAAESNSDKLLLTLRLARVYEVSGQWAKTEQCYKTILKANPANVMALNNLAYLYADKLDRPDEARTLIERALRRNPGNANLMDTYAWALAKSGRYQEALEAFNNIARLDSIDERAATSVDTLYHMGFVHEKLGDSRAAKGYYQRAMELIRDQDDHPLYPTLSQALARIDS
jgi:tetratricopeptide (TPR) repeat protein